MNLYAVNYVPSLKILSNGNPINICIETPNEKESNDMDIKEAMLAYFSKLEDLYQRTFGTLPTTPWDSDTNPELFIGTPDEDDEIQWRPIDAIPMQNPKLCRELCDFYSSYYYCQLRGEYEEILFDFPAVCSFTDSSKIADSAIVDGEYYFPGQNTVLIATCTLHGNDDILLFYKQNTGDMILYDIDKKTILPFEHSLVELITSMKAVI